MTDDVSGRFGAWERISKWSFTVDIDGFFYSSVKTSVFSVQNVDNGILESDLCPLDANVQFHPFFSAYPIKGCRLRAFWAFFVLFLLKQLEKIVKS